MSLLGNGEATLLRKNEQNQQLQAGAGVLIPQEFGSQGDFHNAPELEFSLSKGLEECSGFPWSMPTMVSSGRRGLLVCPIVPIVPLVGKGWSFIYTLLFSHIYLLTFDTEKAYWPLTPKRPWHIFIGFYFTHYTKLRQKNTHSCIVKKSIMLFLHKI